MQNRRDFLKGAVFAGAACAAANNLRADGAGPAGAPMLGFACKPLETVRVGVVGLGSRGMGMIGRVSKLPGVVVTAVCDIQDARINLAKNSLAKQKRPEPKVYKGPEAFRALCDSGDVDVIYNSTPWHLHVPVALAAMNGGKHVLDRLPLRTHREERHEPLPGDGRAGLHARRVEDRAQDGRRGHRPRPLQDLRLLAPYAP